MKIPILFIFSILPLRTISAQVAQSAKPPFTLDIEVSRNEAKIGSVNLLEAHWTNTSHHNLFFAVGGLGRATKLEVLNSEGKQVQETPNGRKAQGKDTEFVGSVFRATLQPGKTQTDEIDVSKEYDLSKPGRYTIQAQRWDDESHTNVKSNTITITLTQ